MDNSKLLKKHQPKCAERQTCLYRIDILEKWKEGVEKKIDGLYKLLLANLSGVILTLISGIVALVVYIAGR
jgi:hypothetical protein